MQGNKALRRNVNSNHNLPRDLYLLANWLCFISNQLLDVESPNTCGTQTNLGAISDVRPTLPLWLSSPENRHISYILSRSKRWHQSSASSEEEWCLGWVSAFYWSFNHFFQRPPPRRLLNWLGHPPNQPLKKAKGHSYRGTCFQKYFINSRKLSPPWSKGRDCLDATWSTGPKVVVTSHRLSPLSPLNWSQL